MSINEDQIVRWSKSPSETQDTKCQNAISQITEAVRKKFGYDVTIDLQGSYKNRTDVKLDSDVDIIVRHNGNYFPNVQFLAPDEAGKFWATFVPSQYLHPQFRNEVWQALIDYLGSGMVEP